MGPSYSGLNSFELFIASVSLSVIVSMLAFVDIPTAVVVVSITVRIAVVAVIFVLAVMVAVVSRCRSGRQNRKQTQSTDEQAIAGEAGRAIRQPTHWAHGRDARPTFASAAHFRSPIVTRLKDISSRSAWRRYLAC